MEGGLGQASEKGDYFFGWGLEVKGSPGRRGSWYCGLWPNLWFWRNLRANEFLFEAGFRGVWNGFLPCLLPYPAGGPLGKNGVTRCLSLLKKWGGAPDWAGFLPLFVRATAFDKATSFSTLSASVDLKSSPNRDFPPWGSRTWPRRGQSHAGFWCVSPVILIQRHCPPGRVLWQRERTSAAGTNTSGSSSRPPSKRLCHADTTGGELLRGLLFVPCSVWSKVLGEAFPQVVHQVLVWFRRSASIDIWQGVLFK